MPVPQSPTLYPYTTLFRSQRRAAELNDFDLARLAGEQEAALRAMIQSSVAAGAVSEAEEGQQREMSDLRSEEHTSELQSRFDIVCRLLLEKKINHPY